MANTVSREGIYVPVGSHAGKNVAIGSDHGGFYLKEKFKEWLEKGNWKVLDVGTFSRERCDYPEFSEKVAREIEKSPLETVGILVCRSGIGTLIPAMRHPNVFGARCLTKKDAEFSRMHNNSNLISIGADLVSEREAIEMLRTWLETPFFPLLKMKNPI